MNHSKGRVLFLSYYFPPAAAVACVRTWALAKHLSRLGWQMKVVTPREHFWAMQDAEPLRERDAESIECWRTGYCWPFLCADTNAARHPLWGKIGYLVSRLRPNSGWEPMIGWYHAARRQLRTLAPGSVDVVLASGWPFCSFSLADQVSARLGIPFVLDYRDLWTSNPHAPWLNTGRNRIKEASLLARCNAVTAVSQRMAVVLREKCAPDKVHVATNGFDRDQLSQVKPYVFPEKAVVYTGRLMPPLRTLDPIIRAMAEILATSETASLPFRLHYFGPGGTELINNAAQFGVSAWVVDHGAVSRQEALAAVAGAHLAIVVTSVRETATDAESGIVTGKVFEALGLGRRVLVIAPSGSDVEAIVGPNGRRFSGSQTKDIARYIIESTTAEVSPMIEPPKDCCWETLSRRYDALLESTRSY